MLWVKFENRQGAETRGDAAGSVRKKVAGFRGRGGILEARPASGPKRGPRFRRALRLGPASHHGAILAISVRFLGALSKYCDVESPPASRLGCVAHRRGRSRRARLLARVGRGGLPAPPGPPVFAARRREGGAVRSIHRDGCTLPAARRSPRPAPLYRLDWQGR